jgi:phospholipase C
MALKDIDTIIIVSMENRSFEHMLEYLTMPGPGQKAVEALQAGSAWLDSHANFFKGVADRSSRQLAGTSLADRFRSPSSFTRFNTSSLIPDARG